MAYRDCKDLTRRTASGKKYVVNHLILLKMASMVYKYFDKDSAAHKGTWINSDVVSDNQQLPSRYDFNNYM